MISNKNIVNINILLLSLSCFIMTLSLEFRVLTFLCLALTLPLCFAMVLNVLTFYKLVFSKLELYLFGILIYFVIKDILLIFFINKEPNGFYHSLTNLLVVFELIIIARYLPFSDILKKAFYTLSFFGVLFSVPVFMGVSIFSNDNFLPAILLPLSLYFLTFTRVSYLNGLYIISTFALSIIFEARGVTGLLFIAFMCRFYLFKNITKSKLLILGLLCILLAQYWALKENSTQLNEFLTYRPVIWSYYLEVGFDSFFFGQGYLTDDIASGAAYAYSTYAQKGVAEAYGTQSMVLRYFVEAGFLGVIMVCGFLYLVLKKNGPFLFPCVLYVLLSFLESIVIGSISIYGFPLTLFLLSNFVKDYQKLEVRSYENKNFPFR